MEGHGGADGTSLARMGIRHDADTAAAQKRLVAHGLELLRRYAVQTICKDLCRIKFTLDFNHIDFSLANIVWGLQPLPGAYPAGRAVMKRWCGPPGVY